MNINNVIVLYEGYSNEIDENVMDANCTCTLIKGVNNIIIDTMTAWDKDKILKALAKENIQPDDISYVICTHNHTDHIGNNNLFCNATHIVGNCVQKKTLFYDKDIKNTDYVINKGIKVMATPGHTEEDISIIVEGVIENKLCIIGVAGDLFEKYEDIHNPSIWMNLGTPHLQITQAESRYKLANAVDIIIPGHGPPFRITKEIKEILAKQAEEVKK